MYPYGLKRVWGGFFPTQAVGCVIDVERGMIYGRYALYLDESKIKADPDS